MIIKFTYWVALGSNLGNRSEELGWAVDYLNRGGKVLRKSSRYRSAPMGFESEEWFENAVVEWETSLAPIEALDFVKNGEEERGKRPLRSEGIYNDRHLDIDLLWWSSGIFRSKELTIPHPRMLDRDFVMIPLMEMEKEWAQLMEKEELVDLIFTDSKLECLGSL